MNENKTAGFTSPILILLLVVASFLMGMIWTQSRQKDEVENLPVDQQEEEALEQEEQVSGESAAALGNFKTLEKTEVCLEDDKPLVYYFGRSSCPYCTWQHPVITSAVEGFENVIAFHDNMDKPEVDREIYEKYSLLNQGAIPFIVIGCQYWQLGSGEAFGEEQEANHIAALICKVTNNEPEEICAPLQETIDSI